jgi:Rhodopirellula transposase DDE domain
VLSAELFAQHVIRVSDRTVAKLLRSHGYSLQAPNKAVEGAQHPDRNAQFEHINAKAQACVERGVPVISVDTKKKELVGNFKNGGREWQPKGEPELVDVHDFPSDAVGKAIPYGVYDVAANDGFVSVGVDHDTPVFAVTSIEAWWRQVGQKRYPKAREIFITADAGGSNSYRSHVWKQQLQRLADKLGLAIHVSHFPPGTSKWNKVEHRLFSFISINWRGRPLRSYETVINLIGNTTNVGGLVVRARLDRRNYPIGKKVSAKELRELKIDRHDFHGDWNYVIKPRNAQG